MWSTCQIPRHQVRVYFHLLSGLNFNEKKPGSGKSLLFNKLWQTLAVSSRHCIIIIIIIIIVWNHFILCSLNARRDLIEMSQ